MRTTILMALVITLAPMGCGGEKGDSPKKSHESSDAEPSKPDKTALAPTDEVATQKAPVKINEILATGTLESDAGAGSEVKVTLKMLSQNRLGGTLQIGNTAHELTGILDDKTIRCWTIKTGGAADDAWRGILVGTGQESAYNGTFNLSNSGASKIIAGTWKTN